MDYKEFTREQLIEILEMRDKEIVYLQKSVDLLGAALSVKVEEIKQTLPGADPERQKKAVIELYENGLSGYKIANELKLPMSSVYRIIKLYKAASTNE